MRWRRLRMRVGVRRKRKRPLECWICCVRILGLGFHKIWLRICIRLLCWKYWIRRVLMRFCWRLRIHCFEIWYCSIKSIFILGKGKMLRWFYIRMCEIWFEMQINSRKVCWFYQLVYLSKLYAICQWSWVINSLRRFQCLFRNLWLGCSHIWTLKFARCSWLFGELCLFRVFEN